MTSDLRTIVDSFEGKRVLVIGDVMLDRYWWGDVTRISPEAPVPVVSLKRESAVLGGAANVAANVTGLGCEAVLCGVVGNDDSGALVAESLRSAGIASDTLVTDTARPTTVKTRIVAHNQQIVRLDNENPTPLTGDTEETLLTIIRREIPLCDTVIASDYAKGCLTDNVLSETMSLASQHGKRVIVDPKGRDFSKYRGAFLLTPNQKEAFEAARVASGGAEALTELGRLMVADLALGALLITRGEHGLLLLEGEGDPFVLGATAREVFDVTGAGDTVIATLATALAAGAALQEAAELANLAAGIVVEHIGTTSVTREMLLQKM